MVAVVPAVALAVVPAKAPTVVVFVVPPATTTPTTRTKATLLSPALRASLALRPLRRLTAPSRGAWFEERKY